ncbi:hypothetical protein J3U18_05540 [Gilliamella sp. B3482]|uniref:hypothetical protein n=1 Tax=Gilliamella sp. B3482 TaxID=2817991 RepID=UPI002269ABBE|nr:hypothetical protein [Gilliamella sp. B3482]MCX8581152.1 hypothetical protein [Gilliamella sp. B3482]
MKNNLVISAQGFSDENTANIIANFTATLIKELVKQTQLNISKLKRVLISCDFESALADIAKEYGHESSSFTNNKQSVAIAQLLSKLTDNGLYSEFTLVLSVEFFYDLFNKDGSISLDHTSNIIHMMHHELIHIHEKNESRLDAGKLVDEYDDAILMTSTRSWSEFLANYMSAQTSTPKLIKMQLSSLETALIDIPKEIKSLVNRYKVGLLSLDEMYFNVKNKVKLIANLYGYAFGYMSSIKIEPNLYPPSLLDLLENTKLSSLLKKLAESFLELKDIFYQGKLSDYEMFENANKTIHSIYKLFGLTLDRQQGTLYIHVD